jgi:dienelactone hydrolase
MSRADIDVMVVIPFFSYGVPAGARQPQHQISAREAIVTTFSEAGRTSHQSGVNRFSQLKGWFGRSWRAVAPGARAWKGAAYGLLLTVLLVLFVAFYNYFGAAGPATFVAGALAFLAASALIGSLLRLLAWLVRKIPYGYGWVLTVTLPALIFLGLTALTAISGFLAVLLGTIAVASLLGAGIWVLANGGWRESSPLRRSIAVMGLGVGLVGAVTGGGWLLGDGSQATPPVNAALLSGEVLPLEMPDPSQPGPYVVQRLFYGSGEDRHRPEYAAAALATHPVDGSLLVDSWTGLRTRYWGFGPEAMPLNGRVWYPEGAGPFPLVLIVHGNHLMEKFSDSGYAYLGELLASRGFITVSVDQNFLNLSMAADLLVFKPLEKENDARAWLLLEHLRQWQAWNQDPETPFYQKVDLDRVVLVGHSRGGEAVAVAAAFNRLPYYPDNAALSFDYNFGIQGVVAIAPVDGQYKPQGKATPVENVNYLVLHGAHDMDVITFMGSRQYERVTFTGDDFRFKAALYLYGANHGQFNTAWGRKDITEPTTRLFNLRQLMPAEEQRQVGKVYISAFVESTLNGQTGYLPLFRDERVASAWLPETIYLSRYDDSTVHYVSTYEEDIDLATTTLPGGRQQGQHLTLWREQLVPSKWGDAGAHAVFLGWDDDADDGVASYTITLPEQGLSLDGQSTLVFALADAALDPQGKGPPAASPKGRDPIDLTIQVVDRQGNASQIPLSHFRLVQPQIEGHIAKQPWRSPIPPVAEIVFQTFEAPLSVLAAANPDLDASQIAGVRFLFDRTPAGVVVLNDVGFR